MRNDFESNYLAHHGILGQKWGKKNGPPYPLDASDHSSSEKKAGWRESLKAKKEERKKNKEQKYFSKEVKKASKGKYTLDSAQKSIDTIVRNKLTDDQKKLLSEKKVVMEKDQKAAIKAYSKEWNAEYNKRFKNKKPTGSELEQLDWDIDERMAGSKTSEKAFESWKDYIDSSRSITNDLIGKYGSKKFSDLNPATYNHVINRILDDVASEEITNKKQKIENEIKELQQMANKTGWKQSKNDKHSVEYIGNSKNGGEIDLAYDDYINIAENIRELKKELKNYK